MVTPYTYFMLLTLHVMGIVVWIGGSFFIYASLPSPASHAGSTTDKLALWEATFAKFFRWVWLGVAVVFISGEWLAHGWLDGLNAPLYIHVMFGIGVLLMLFFGHLYFAPYKRMRRAIAAGNEADALKELGRIRTSLGIIGIMGLVVVIIGVSGPIFMGQPLVLDPFSK